MYIYQSEESFRTALARFIKMERGRAIIAHSLASYAVMFAAEHGRADYLNTLSRGLRKSDRDALRAWIGEIMGDDKFLSAKRDGEHVEYNVLKNTMNARTEFLANFDPKKVRAFVDKPRKDPDPFDDKQLLARVKTLRAKAQDIGHENDNIDKAFATLLKAVEKVA